MRARQLVFRAGGHTLALVLGRDIRANSEITIERIDEAGTIKFAPSDDPRQYQLRAGMSTLSQRHARVQITADEQIFIKDLGSTNGTFVRVPPGLERQMESGAEVLLGRELTLHLDAPALSGQGEEVSAESAEQLAALVRHALRAQAGDVRIGKSTGGRAPLVRLELPLLKGDQHLIVEWRRGTRDVEAERWLRDVVTLFNIQQTTREESSWRFTAVSDRRQNILRMAQRLALKNCTILICGPSGSGKDVLANDIHNHSLRAQGPFVAINCANVPKDLFEGELFGTAKGAFTGAMDKLGLLKHADGGTVFLDEIGEMPFGQQPKLLRFLEDHKVRRVGSNEEQLTDVRVIAATNRNLEKMVDEGTFREDLFHRLNVVQLDLPQSLDPTDVRELARVFLSDAPEGRDLPAAEIEEIIDEAARERWRGSARELSKAIERYFLFREPSLSAGQNWRMARPVVAGTAERPALPPAPDLTQSLNHRPLDAVALLDNLLFLVVVKEVLEKNPRSGVAEIARMVHRTPQAVHNRFKNLGVKLDGHDDVLRIQEKMEAARDALAPYVPWLRAVLSR